MRENQPFEVSSAEINRRFGEIRRRAETGPVAVTFHGRKALIISSLSDYERLAASEADGDMATTWRRVVQLILDHMREGYFSVDADMIVRTVNRVAELFVGRTRDELVGLHFRDAFPAIANDSAALQAVMDDGQIVQVERSSSLHPDRRVAVTMIPLPTPPGGVGVLFDNVTQQVRMQATLVEQEAAIGTLLESVGDQIIFSVNSKERIALWGKGAEGHLGWSASDVQNAPVKSILVSPTKIQHGAAETVTLRRDDGSEVTAVGAVRNLSKQSAATLYVLRPLSDLRSTGCSRQRRSPQSG